MTFPLERIYSEDTDAVGATADGYKVLGAAKEAETVISVTYTPISDITGVDTESRTFNLYNRGTDGNGTTLVATLAMVNGVNAVNDDEKAITLSATAANLLLTAGQILEWESLHVGSTGLADPGGRVTVMTRRTQA